MHYSKDFKITVLLELLICFVQLVILFHRASAKHDSALEIFGSSAKVYSVLFNNYEQENFVDKLRIIVEKLTFPKMSSKYEIKVINKLEL